MATRRDCGEDDDELRRQLRFYTGATIGPISNTTRRLYVKKLKKYKSMEVSSKMQNRDAVACEILLSTDRLSGSLDTLNDKDFQTNDNESVLMDSKSSFTKNNNYTSSPGLSSLTRPSIHSRLKPKTDENNFNRPVNKNELLKSNGFYRHDENEKSSEDNLYIVSAKDLYFNNSLNNVPFILISAGIIFFAVIMYLYLYYGYNTVVFTDPRDVFPLCPKNWDYEYGHCILKSSFEEFQALIGEILQQTSMRTGELKCGERKEALLSIPEVEEIISKPGMTYEVETLLNLFVKNPHWGVVMLDSNQLQCVDTRQAVYLLNSKYTLTWSCRLSTLLTDCAYMVVVVVLVGVTLVTVRSLYLHLEWRAEVESAELNDLMERVVDMLKSQATISCFTPYTFIDPWLREDYIVNILISAEEQSGKEKLWPKALAILKKNESRLAFKYENIHGKEILMIRWMTLSSLISSSSSPSNRPTKTSLPSPQTSLPSPQTSLPSPNPHQHQPPLRLSSLKQSSLSSPPSSPPSLSSSSSSPPSLSSPSSSSSASSATSYFTANNKLITNDGSSSKHNHHQRHLSHQHIFYKEDKLNYVVKPSHQQHNHKNNQMQQRRVEPLQHKQQPPLNKLQQQQQQQFYIQYNNQNMQSSHKKNNSIQHPQQINNSKNSPLQLNNHHNNHQQQPLTHNNHNNSKKQSVTNHHNISQLNNTNNSIQLNHNINHNNNLNHNLNSNFNNNHNDNFNNNHDNNLNHNHNSLPFKCWQGSAISGPNSCHDNSIVNNLTPLTKCLKVRDMFDISAEVDASSWQQVVRDAILEKVGMGHKILQISVDCNSKEGCVYIRCADVNSAGEVFTRLHGWWFDGRLVTVKYLKLKRFIERFPEGSDNRTPLVPSNDHRISLSIPPYNSVLEDT